MPQTAAGCFSFLNREKCFPSGSIDWQNTEMPRLWLYNLHYFDYLQDPHVSRQDKLAWMEDWIENNPQGSEFAWEPYTVSLRIVNWIKFLQGYSDAQRVPDVIRSSLALQAEWLYHNLEYHILANHLFKNIKALIFAAQYFEGKYAEKWLKLGERLLRSQLQEQILPDGGHYERSPMYHCIILQDMLDLLYVRHRQPDDTGNDLLRDCAVRAAFFLRDITLGDGEIPLFNDSAMGIAPTPPQLLTYASDILQLQIQDRITYPRQRYFKDSGYFVLGNRKQQLVIDCGETGPRHQPGHTHCDTLGFELGWGEQRVLVDSGTHDYEAGERRSYDRSTRAHNTLAIKGHEQSDVWGVFRVARRARPLKAELSVNQGGQQRFQGSYRGFQTVGFPVIHQRTVEFDGKQRWQFQDRITAKKALDFTVYLHFHPDIRLQTVNKRLVLYLRGLRLAQLQPPENCEVKIRKTPYHPEFGIEVSKSTVEMVCADSGATEISYSLTFNSPGN